MNKSEKKIVLDAVLAMRNLDDELHNVSNVVGINYESPLFTKIDIVCELLIKCSSLIARDDGEWIDWYIYENDYGRKDLKVAFGDDEPVCVKSMEQLFRVIQRHNLQKEEAKK